MKLHGVNYTEIQNWDHVPAWYHGEYGTIIEDYGDTTYVLSVRNTIFFEDAMMAERFIEQHEECDEVSRFIWEADDVFLAAAFAAKQRILESHEFAFGWRKQFRAQLRADLTAGTEGFERKNRLAYLRQCC